MRVRISPKELAEDHSWAVLPQMLRSSVDVTPINSPAEVGFATRELRVSLQRNTGKITFANSGGDVISADYAARPASFHGSSFKVYKAMPPNEHYFGLGDKPGPLDRRSRAFAMWNTDAFAWQESTDPLYKSIPFFLSLRDETAYGIYLDNTWRSHFDFGREIRDAYSFGSDGGQLDYYFIFGPHPKKVIERLTALLGRTPLPPLWTLGYQQCRYSYYPEARVREVATTFRQKRISLDSIYLDIDYQLENRPFTVDPKKFPTFNQMIRDLKQLGIHTIAIVDPHIAKIPGYFPYDSGLVGDHFAKNPDGLVYVGRVWPGDSVFPEFTRKATRDWWGSLFKRFYLDDGIGGFWNDMNEPAIFGRADKTMPLDIVHRIDDPDQGMRSTTHREIHNVFGMQNSRATYEGLLKLNPDVRPFVLTRASFAGGQRYAATWTGDNVSTYNHFRMTTPQLLSLGISGYAFVGDDIGGFSGNPSPDLLTRWMELGAFNPLYRNHSAKGTADKEPWVHGTEHEAIRKRYIEVRYRLLPYLYTAFEESSRTGIPVMRPLFMEYPELGPRDSEFLFGPDLLVIPKQLETLEEYTAELPSGAWYDYWTGKKIESAKKMRLNPPLDVLPVFARGGAIIPHQPLVQSTEEVPNGPLELRIYPGPNCKGTVYADDGKTFAYTRGEYIRKRFTCDPTDEILRINVDPSEGAYKPWWRELRFAIYGCSRRPKAVTVEDRPVDFSYDAKSETAAVVIPENQQRRQIAISF